MLTYNNICTIYLHRDLHENLDIITIISLIKVHRNKDVSF